MSNRFRRYGRTVTIDEVVKDCRDLDSLVTTQSKLIETLIKANEELAARVAALESGGP